MAYRAAVQGQRLEECQLILPMFYINTFKQNRSQCQSIISIYMLFTNTSREESEAAESRYLLCLMPLNTNLFNTLRLIIITPMHLLKRRYNVYFKAKQATHHCYGSVYCILSNHPSQVLCAGTFPTFHACVSYS